MEKLFLGRFLACKKLNIIEQKKVHASVRSCEFKSFFPCDGVDKIVGEFLGGYVEDLEIGKVGGYFVSYGLNQVGFPEPASAIYI